MAFSISQNTNSRPYTRYLIYFLVVVGFILLIFFGNIFFRKILNISSKSGLSVEVLNGDADVYINNEKVGKTPFESSTISPGDNVIKLQTEKRSFQTTIKFIKDSSKIPFVNIKRDLGISDLFSSGQNAWYEKNDNGSLISIISEPSGASVYIDGTEVGKTPFSSNNLTEDSYDVRLEYIGYESQTSRVTTQKGYKLNVSFKLFPMPVPSKLSSMEGSENLYNGILDNSLVVSDTESWVNSVIYWNQTRGVNLDGLGLNKSAVFDYYLDYKGNVYDKSGTLLNPVDGFNSLKDAKRGLYMGRISDGMSLTQSAKIAFEQLSGKVVLSTRESAKIRTTPTGWLNVRSEASLNGEILTKVNVGENYSVLEKATGWIKIRVSETVSGWVSADYVDIT